MGSIFDSTKNTRSILTDSFRFLRSDVPDHLTAREIQWLLEQNVLTIVDLREDGERGRRKCPLEEDERFHYISMPVTGGNAVPKTPEEVSQSYIRMADDQMKKIIGTIWNAKSNVMYFCNAGKDRTGVVSAILLSKLGKTPEYILADYMKSGENLKDMLEQYAASESRVRLDVITPHENYMKAFLAWLNGRKM